MDSKTPETSPDEVVARLVAGTSSNLLVSVLKGELYATLVALATAQQEAVRLKGKVAKLNGEVAADKRLRGEVHERANAAEQEANELRAERDDLKDRNERMVSMGIELNCKHVRDCRLHNELEERAESAEADCAAANGKATRWKDRAHVAEAGRDALKKERFDLSRYVNASSISGNDSPYIVVQKLQAAIDSAIDSAIERG